MTKRILAAVLATMFLVGAGASAADARPFHDSNAKPFHDSN